MAVEKEGRKKQGHRNTLLALYYEDGVWWRHAINIQKTLLPMKTLFDDPVGIGTEKALNREALIIFQEWSEARWKGK